MLEAWPGIFFNSLQVTRIEAKGPADTQIYLSDGKDFDVVGSVDLWKHRIESEISDLFDQSGV